jgi:AAA domain
MAGTWTNVDPLVRFFCCDPQNGRFGPYVPLQERGENLQRTELLPGSMWRYRVVDETGLPVDLHVYAGLGDDVGLLWGLEARTLLQLGARGFVGLPESLDGGYISTEETSQIMPGVDGLAVIATRAADQSLADEDAAAYMARDLARAVRALARLAEALAELHAKGMIHGSLWPGAVYVTADPRVDNADVQCWLARFEMTSLLANHARLGHGKPFPEADATRYAAPELQGDIAATKPAQVAKADVYSLAAIATEWFAGELEEAPAESSQWAVLLKRAPRAPAVLTRLLLQMLDAPGARPEAIEVARRLREIERVLAAWSRDMAPAPPPHLLFYLPETARMLATRAWIAPPHATLEGRAATGRLIEADLRGGYLLYSPRGAAPFVSGNPEATSEARYVLIGQMAAWFCAPYREPRAFRLDPPRHDALVVKYFVEVPSRTLEALFRDNPRLNLPAVEVISLDVAQPVRESALTNRPSWAHLLDALPSPILPHDALFDEAIAWLLRYQSLVLYADCYACTLVDADGVEVQIDQERDTVWIHRDLLLSRYALAARNRPALGDFLTSLDADGSGVVELVGDVAGRPSPAEHRSLWFAERAIGPDRVALRPAAGSNTRPPERCWIRPAHHAATAAQLRSQIQASEELKRMPRLRSQLQTPRSRHVGGERWQSATVSLPSESAAAVEEMLAYSPFYALQGPPGAGKTTIAAKAVAAWLRANPNGRVLVSAQSNVALDALAERILAAIDEPAEDGRLGNRDAVLAWRPAVTDERVSPGMSNWTDQQLTDRVAHRIRAEVTSALATSLEPGLRTVLERWRRMLDEPGIMPELTRRLTRSANLVFATHAMSRPSVIRKGRERDLFDWAVVEDAARAWPTELLLPLTSAATWTLLGDHRQLPAYGRDRLDRFLDLLESDPTQEAAVPADRRNSYERVFDLFENYFENTSHAAMSERPLRRLTIQYRMAGPISQLVGESFYSVPGQDDASRSSGLLYGGPPRTSPVTAPAALAGRFLVWIDTHDHPGCQDEPFWVNRGEATLVAQLVASIRPPVDPRRPGQLAVLTPYRRQLDVLLATEPMMSGLAGTVHSFQGREAEIVVVSLVRDTQRGTKAHDQDRPWLGLGHLSQPQLVNVLLSRARSLLVLVGDFEHFARYERTVWGRICQTIRGQGAVVPASDLFASEED